MLIPWDRKKKHVLNLDWKTEDILITTVCLWILIFTLTLTCSSVKGDFVVSGKIESLHSHSVWNQGAGPVLAAGPSTQQTAAGFLVNCICHGPGCWCSLVSDGYNSIIVKGVSFTLCKPVVKGCALVSMFFMTESA